MHPYWTPPSWTRVLDFSTRYNPGEICRQRYCKAALHGQEEEWPLAGSLWPSAIKPLTWRGNQGEGTEWSDIKGWTMIPHYPTGPGYSVRMIIFTWRNWFFIEAGACVWRCVLKENWTQAETDFFFGGGGKHLLKRIFFLGGGGVTSIYVALKFSVISRLWIRIYWYPISEIQTASPGIEPQIPSLASQELNHSTTTALQNRFIRSGIHMYIGNFQEIVHKI